MKTLAVLSFVVLMGSAQAALPAPVAALANRPGTLVTHFNGKVIESESNIDCEIKVGRWDEGAVEIDAAVYFMPTASLSDAEVSVKNGVTIYKTDSTGKRPGGSVCGDIAPLTSYKKTAEVSGKSLTIREKYTCALFERNESVSTCTVK